MQIPPRVRHCLTPIATVLLGGEHSCGEVLTREVYLGFIASHYNSDCPVPNASDLEGWHAGCINQSELDWGMITIGCLRVFSLV